MAASLGQQLDRAVKNAGSGELAGDGAGVVVDPGADRSASRNWNTAAMPAAEVLAGGLEVLPGAEVGAAHPHLGDDRVVGVVGGDQLEGQVGEGPEGGGVVAPDLVGAVVDALVADELVAGVGEARERGLDVVAVLGVEQRVAAPPRAARAAWRRCGVTAAQSSRSGCSATILS